MKLLFVFLLSLVSAQADQASYDQGKSLAQSLDQGLQQGIPEGIPAINPESVQEAHYQENFHKLSEAATAMTHDSELGSYVLESQKTRKEVDYRVTEDSEIVRNGNEVVADPMKFIGGEEEREEGGEQEVVETTHLCEESAEEAIYTCEESRYVTLKKPGVKEFDVTTGIYYYSGPPSEAPSYHDPVPAILKDRIISNDVVFIPPGSLKTTYQYRDFLSEEHIIETFSNSCAGYEEQANKGLCRYGEEEILEGPGTREFCEGEDCISVTKKWWKRRRTYHCKHPSKDNCGPFRAAGCEQVDASCLKRVGGVCVNNQKTFLCKSVVLGNGQVRFTGDVPFCMDGNCDDHSWASNKDFADAMSKLSMFQEMSKDMDPKNATLFRGNVKKCSKSTLSFQDCCGSGGWGRSVGLGQNCKEEEKELKKEREAKKCVRVGTYCSQKEGITKICLTKKTSFCCFSSKLSKLLHEQGRAQLGIGWGDAEHPDCRPFTIDEIQRIDFSKIDFSVLYEEIRAKTNEESFSTAAEGLGGRWSDKVKAAQSQHGKKVKASELYNTKENPDVAL